MPVQITPLKQMVLKVILAIAGSIIRRQRPAVSVAEPGALGTHPTQPTV